MIKIQKKKKKVYLQQRNMEIDKNERDSTSFISFNDK